MGVKARGTKLHVTHANSTCKLKAFSILLRTQTVHSEVSFIIYTALSMPFYLFAVCFEIFERLAKTLQILKGFTAAIQDHILISSFSHGMHINEYPHMLCTKNKSIFDGSKDRLKKILIQFSKLQGKKPFVGPFLSPKTLS